MFIDSGNVTPKWGKEPPVMTTREALKKNATRKESGKLIVQDWRKIEGDWTKKELGC